MSKFSKVLGYRGTDGAECRWLAVLVDAYCLITAYPIPHPKTLKFMRESLLMNSSGDTPTKPRMKSLANKNIS